MRCGGGGRQKKGGDGRPLFPYAGERCYRFFPPFFFPPLAAFFAIVSSPLSAWCAAEGLNSALASRPLGLPDPCAKRPGSVANRTSADARSTTRQKKKKGAGTAAAPSRPITIDEESRVHRSTRFAGPDCRRNPSRMSLPENSAPPSLTVPNKWAERIALTQDVDYGRVPNCVKHKLTRVVKTPQPLSTRRSRTRVQWFPDRLR